MDPVCQMFQILKSHGQDYLSRANFLPLVQGLPLIDRRSFHEFNVYVLPMFTLCFIFILFNSEVVDGHPGLEFLEHTPEFQQRYSMLLYVHVYMLLC